MAVYIMKAALLLAILFFGQVAIAQMAIDTTLSQKYAQAKVKFPQEIQAAIEEREQEEKGEKSGLGLALCITSTIDTLNKKDINTNNYAYKSEESGTLDIFFCGGNLKDNALEISMWTPFGNQFIDYEIKGNAVKVTFKEYYKNDYVLKSQITDTLTNELDIPGVISEFAVSSKDFTNGKTIYGFCNFSTQPYFIVNRFSHEEAPLKIKRHYKCYFKFTVKGD